MNPQVRLFVHGIVFVLGLVLMVGGVATSTNGAVVIGLIVAAASFGAWQRWTRA